MEGGGRRRTARRSQATLPRCCFSRTRSLALFACDIGMQTWRPRTCHVHDTWQLSRCCPSSRQLPICRAPEAIVWTRFVALVRAPDWIKDSVTSCDGLCLCSRPYDLRRAWTGAYDICALSIFKWSTMGVARRECGYLSVSRARTYTADAVAQNSFYSRVPSSTFSTRLHFFVCAGGVVLPHLAECLMLGWMGCTNEWLYKASSTAGCEKIGMQVWDDPAKRFALFDLRTVQTLCASPVACVRRDDRMVTKSTRSEATPISHELLVARTLVFEGTGA